MSSIADHDATAAAGHRAPAPEDFFGVPIHPVSYDSAWELIRVWASSNLGRCVCFAAVASAVHAKDMPDFRLALSEADLVLPDGMPTVWTLRRAGRAGQERLCGPDLVFRFCGDAAAAAIPIGFIGSTDDILRRIRANLLARWPQLDIRYSYSPPFRPLSDAEEDAIAEAINRSGVRLLFVGLGCPKQELWMARMRDRARVVMVGIGGAFDIAAGIRGTPSLWIQRLGLQWAYRLCQEPTRLWRRYAFHNARFLYWILRRQLSRWAGGRAR